MIPRSGVVRLFWASPRGTSRRAIEHASGALQPQRRRPTHGCMNACMNRCRIKVRIGQRCRKREFIVNLCRCEVPREQHTLPACTAKSTIVRVLRWRPSNLFANLGVAEQLKPRPARRPIRKLHLYGHDIKAKRGKQ